MDIIRFAIQNPVKVAVGVILTVLFGLIALFTIPIQLIPNVDQPIITIETTWAGRSPEEVEREIVEEQEEYLKTLSGLDKMTAEASTGQATVKLEFLIGTDIKDARTRVSDKLREVPAYPDEVDEPVITDADADPSKAIAWIIFDAENDDFDMPSLFDYAEDYVKPEIERVPGVSRVNVLGGREREVHVRIDPRALAERGITFNELRDALRLENVNISAGELTDGMREYRVRTIGQYDELTKIENTVVRYDEAGPVRIKDLGDAVETLEKPTRFVRANGQSALAINAIRETGSNVMTVMDGIRTAIDHINDDLLPNYEGGVHGLHLRQVYDETVYISDAIGLVQSNLVIGGVLAALVLLVFLGKVRPTLIIALAIPVSVIGAFLVLSAAGRNLNVISLAGMAFAVGMVIDNAIVVLENIDRHLHMGKRPMEAAYDGAREVWGAILASTLTTLAVFVPVLTVEEEAGQLFFDISLALCAAVTLSLIVSITVIPAASARWLRPAPAPGPGSAGGGEDHVGWFAKVTAPFSAAVAGFSNLVYQLTERNTAAAVARIVIIAGFTLVSLGGAYLLMPPTSYLPNGNQNLIFGMMLTPPAYSMEQSRSIAERIEPQIEPYWQVDTVEEATAIRPVMMPNPDPTAEPEPFDEVPPIQNYFFVRSGPLIFMGAASSDKEIVQPLAPLLTGAMASIPGSFGFAQQRSIFGRGASGTSSIDVELVGPDLDALRQSATSVFMALMGEYGPRAVQPNPMNFNLAGPEVQFRVDQVRASDLGVDTASVGAAMRAMVDGLVVGDYRLAGDSVDLLITRSPDYPLSPDALASVPLAVRDSDGQTRVVPISALGDFVPGTAPQQINRIDAQRSISFSVTPPQEQPLEQAVDEIEAMLGGMKASSAISPTVLARTAGSADKLNQVRASLLGEWTGFNLDSLQSLASSRMFLAVLIVFLVMAALFESFLYPLVIMFAVPLATVGGFIGLWLVRLFFPSQQLDTLTMLGFVILIGVVVNNAILIVHQALNFMRGYGESSEDKIEAMQPRDAIRESVRTRIRPIFMTTTTSVCGMLPLVLMGGSGSELYKGLGSVVVGGLIVATIFTLVVVPLLFSLVVQARRRVLGTV